MKKYKSSNYPEVTKVVDHLYDEMVDAYRLRLTRNSSVTKLKYHIEFFVLNLYKKYSNSSTGVIAYSRDRNTYSTSKDKQRIAGATQLRYACRYALSYRYTVEVTETGGKPVLRFLEEQGYMENFNGINDRVIRTDLIHPE